MAAGASERYVQMIFPFMDISRHQIPYQRKIFPCLEKFFFLPRKKKRTSQSAVYTSVSMVKDSDIKHNVSFIRDSVFETERTDIDRKIR